jgi:CRISPR-associated protein Cmr3
MTAWTFIRPTDTLFVRGNLAFGEAGEHGAGLMPPPPSLFAGALRSALLGQDAQVLSEFMAIGTRAGPLRLADERLHRCLGTPTAPGAFRLSWLGLAGRRRAAGPAVEALLPLPADLLWLGHESGFGRLLPRPLPAGLRSGGDLPLRATLQTPRQAKPEGGRYLSQAGLALHLHGGPRLPTAADAIEAGALHQRDPRLGIGLNADSRSVEEGLIYTTEGYAFSPAGKLRKDGRRDAPLFEHTGFLVGIEGVDGLLPERGHLRLGGDGRSAEYERVRFHAPAADSAAIAKAGRFRLILQTPGLFGASGWLPPGCRAEPDGSQRLRGPGFAARLACAAVGRREIVSGWDLHQWAPKPAEAAVPAGSVYWFDHFEGDAGKLAEWAGGGLRPDTATAPTPRHAEGWNQALLALWPQD